MSFFFEKKGKTNKTLIERILLENYDQYYRLAYRYAHNETDAFDIVQNGACKAIRSSHTLKEPEYAQTWIYRIILNECFQYLKQPKHLSYEAMKEENGIDAGVTEDRYADVDLQRALDMLPDKDRAVVILKYFEDKKISEIANILEENVNTIKSRLYRSMKKLQVILSDEKTERGGNKYDS